MKLTSIATGLSYIGLINAYTGGGTPPSLFIPKMVPNDLYVASLEIVDGTGKVLFESRPYARLLQIN